MVNGNSTGQGWIVGVDASNLRAGGGLTHIAEILSAARPESHGIQRVVVWGGADTLAKLPAREWLQLENPSSLNGNKVRRIMWQRTALKKAAFQAHCDVLFVPGGSFATQFRPIVTMSRNMLPFELNEMRRYAFSTTGLRLLALRIAQTRSFRRADAVIFLNQYAKETVCKTTGSLPGTTAIIPHGRNVRFEIPPKHQKPITSYSATSPLRLVYVSIIDQYKHQWQVVEAVSLLRRNGWEIQLDLVGPFYAPALTRLNAAVAIHDPQGRWVRYHGSVAHEALHEIYASADIGVFASSCENMPNILLESMSAGLPIACSNRGPMPEMLGDVGTYFDPENSRSIEAALRTLIESTDLRTRYAKGAFERSRKFTWSRCASDTFSLLSAIAAA